MSTMIAERSVEDILGYTEVKHVQTGRRGLKRWTTLEKASIEKMLAYVEAHGYLWCAKPADGHATVVSIRSIDGSDSETFPAANMRDAFRQAVVHIDRATR